jgi:signal transduction histidine kinase
MSEKTSRASIMIVDDSPANLSLLGQLFREKSYAVRPFSKPLVALRAAQIDPPDLFLLDVNMPEMDGYELCRKLKEIDDLVKIPVIFLSTLQDQEDKLRAFESGGVDYVTKQPFHFAEILARVEAHLKLRELQCRFEAQNNELKNNYEQLKRLEEMKENLTHMIVHDMRSPLSVVHMAIQMLQEHAPTMDESSRINLDMAHKATESLMEMTLLLLDIGRLESGKMPLDIQPMELSLTAATCLDDLGIVLRPFQVSLEKEDIMYPAMYDKQVVTRVLRNLLGNAAKFTPKGGRIRVAISKQDGLVRLSVIDSGPGLPVEEQALVFEKFGQGRSEQKKMGTGLGLTFCKLAIEAHGGSIGVNSQPGQGATFWFTLPMA